VLIALGAALLTDGYQTTATLRTMGIQSPILALTGNALAEDQRRFIAAGANAVYPKPVTRAVLQGLLAEYSSWRP